MKKTPSEKPVYTQNQLDRILGLYKELVETRIKLKKIDRGEIVFSDMTKDDIGELCRKLGEAKKSGIENTKEGAELCKDIGYLLKKNYKHYYDSGFIKLSKEQD